MSCKGPHQELWIGYAHYKPHNNWVKIRIWTQPLKKTNSYGVYPPQAASPDQITYTPGPAILSIIKRQSKSQWTAPNPNTYQQDWEFVLQRFARAG